MCDVLASQPAFTKNFSCATPELCGILGDGLNQAADLISGAASIPFVNFTPLMTWGN